MLSTDYSQANHLKEQRLLDNMVTPLPLRQRIEKNKNQTFSHDAFALTNRVRQLDSDMNRHIVRMMHMNEHRYCISLSSLRALSVGARALALAGIMQNLRFLAKQSVPQIVKGCSRTEGLVLLHALGASGQQVKHATFVA